MPTHNQISYSLTPQPRGTLAYPRTIRFPIRQRDTRKMVLFGLIVLVVISCVPALGEEKPAIIWEIGQNTPNSVYWKEHGAELDEMLPFDGVTLSIQMPAPTIGGLMIHNSSLGANVFQYGNRFTDEMAQTFIKNIKAAHLPHLKKNLGRVWFSCGPEPLDYFSDARWDDICNNIRVVARAAREVGCIGLAFDPEQYSSSSCFDYNGLVKFRGEDKSWEEAVAMTRRRGKQFGQAISEVIPDCKLLFFHGHSLGLYIIKSGPGLSWRNRLKSRERGHSLEARGYLYPAFLDGMLEGTSDGTIFIDGMEFAYSYTTAEEFEKGRWMALNESIIVTQVPELFRQKVRCGFGLWLDNFNDDYSWHPFHPEKNRLSPGRLQRTLHLALKYSDGYVWLWNEKSNWYVDGPLGKPHPPAKAYQRAYGMTKAYRDAVRGAKLWPGEDTWSGEAAPLADARTLGFIDRDDLVDLLRSAKVIMQLPAQGWLFKTDREYLGVKEKLYSPETSTGGWSSVNIGEFWERQGYGYDGLAWYRRSVDFRNVPKKKRLYLHFGAVDETMHLWIDGRYAGTYDRGTHGWDKPFALEVTDLITNGKHTLVARVHDRGAMGGIWKPVELVAVE